MRQLALLLPIALAACATTGPGADSIAIDTVSRGQSLPGASCNVSTNAGNWNVVTPASVPVGSASGDLRVVCNKQGYRSSEVVYKPSGGSSGSSVGVGLGGGRSNVGVGVGLSLPIRLGGGNYPSQVTVDMNPQ